MAEALPASGPALLRAISACFGHMDLSHWFAPEYVEYACFATGIFVLRETAFVAIHGFFHLCDTRGWFVRWRVPHKGQPSPALMRKCYKDVVLGHSIQWPFLFMGYALFKGWAVAVCLLFISPLTSSPHTAAAARGMSLTSPLPSTPTALLQTAGALLIYDAMFYWTHRLFHHPLLYARIHKQHHQVGPAAIARGGRGPRRPLPLTRLPGCYVIHHALQFIWSVSLAAEVRAPTLN